MDRYGHLFPGQDEALAKALDEKIGGQEDRIEVETLDKHRKLIAVFVMVALGWLIVYQVIDDSDDFDYYIPPPTEPVEQFQGQHLTIEEMWGTYHE